MLPGIKAIQNLKVGQSVKINACTSNLINAWNIACEGLAHGIELVLDSDGINLIVTRER